MEVLIFQKEAFEEMAAKFSRFSDRVNELLAKQDLRHAQPQFHEGHVPVLVLDGHLLLRMRALTEKNFVKAEDGSLWIHIERQKTGTPECVRLMEIPLAILEKYRGMDADGKLLPMLTKKSMNRHLKKMSVMCGINRPISFHQTRHSFAVNILNNGANIKTVASLFGHSGLKHTEKYTRAVDKLKKEAINSLPEL